MYSSQFKWTALKKKINRHSALCQKEINLAGTLHQCGRTPLRQSILGAKYLIIIKENKIISSLCVPWM